MYITNFSEKNELGITLDFLKKNYTHITCKKQIIYELRELMYKRHYEIENLRKNVHNKLTSIIFEQGVSNIISEYAFEEDDSSRFSSNFMKIQISKLYIIYKIMYNLYSETHVPDLINFYDENVADILLFCMEEKKSLYFIGKYHEYFSEKNHPLTHEAYYKYYNINFINYFERYLNWKKMSQNMLMTEEIIELFFYKLDWTSMSLNINFSLDLAIKYYKNIIWSNYALRFSEETFRDKIKYYDNKTKKFICNELKKSCLFSTF